MSGARIADSAMYGHLWGTPAVRAVFEERGRLQGWLEVLAALARAQAAEGLVPRSAAELITARARVDLLDLSLVAAETRASGHSTLGLIRALRTVLPEDVHPHLYVGATVQDLTDTWTATALRTVLAEVRRDLLRAEDHALDLAVRHRDTLVAGRTHGQPGSPVTFGWKAATWADELRRHLDRLRESEPRWLVGQLGGGVGSLSGQGPRALAVRARFCAELGLADPGISWLTARDRIAEVGAVLAMVTGTLARIGDEVFELQRPEIGEVREPLAPGTVGSITMPHKRNPERSEHLDTLARLTRASAGVLLEGMSGVHERDGRSWKAEWVALPEVCLLAATACAVAADLLAGLEVDADAMARNLDDYTGSEQALTLLGPRLGRHAAREALQTALAEGRRTGRSMSQALVDAGLLPLDEQAAVRPDVTAAGEMVDQVVARARAARGAETVSALAVLPTPLAEAPRLADALGLGAPLLIKRDDLTGFAVAGNKARQLGPLVDDARAAGADVLVTGGTPGSNFVQAAAAAAAWAGLGCVLVLAGSPDGRPLHPNLAAALAWGADLRFTGSADRAGVDAGLPVVAAELAGAGRRPYVVPRGGASPVGASGYRDAVDEVLTQLSGRTPTVVVATGAGGTLAGLVAGNVARGRPLRVVGASVSRPPEEVAARVLGLARDVAALRGEPAPRAADVEIVDARGPGHALPSAEGDRAAATALRTAGLVLDPVYTAKALAVLPAVTRGAPALFWHTGGLLDAVAGWLGAGAERTAGIPR